MEMNYRRQLECCQSKAEVKKLENETIGSFMSEAKDILMNHNIEKNDKQRMLERLLGQAADVQEIARQFVESDCFQKLPEQLGTGAGHSLPMVGNIGIIRLNSNASFENVKMEISSLIREADKIKGQA